MQAFIKGFCALAGCFALMSAGRLSAEPVRLSTPAPSDFVRYGATAGAVSYTALPSPWIVEDWHRLGVKVYARLAPEANESPELFRRRFGFDVFRSGVDGVEWGGTDADRAMFEGAMTAAADDMALARAYDEIARRAMGSGDADKVREGRLAKVFLHVADDFTRLATPLLRREIVRRARILQAALGEKPMAIPKDIPDAPPRRFVPPRDARTVTVDAIRNYTTEFDLFPGMKLQVGAYGATFRIVGDRRLAKDEWPGVKRAFTLYLPGTNRTDWLAYEFSCDLTDRKPADGAASAPRVQFYTLEPRFAGSQSRRFQVRPMRATSRACPNIWVWRQGEAPLYCGAGSGENWSFGFFLAWQRLIGFWPKDKSNCAWYVKEGDEIVRVEWKPSRFADSFKYADFVHDYKDAVTAAKAEWAYSDPLFFAACVEPLIDRNEELAKMLEKNTAANGFLTGWPNEAIRDKATANLHNMQYFACDVDTARIRYLDDILAGRQVKIPEKVKKTEKKVSGPSLEDTGDEIELDDTEY